MVKMKEKSKDEYFESMKEHKEYVKRREKLYVLFNNIMGYLKDLRLYAYEIEEILNKEDYTLLSKKAVKKIDYLMQRLETVANRLVAEWELFKERGEYGG